VFIGLLSSSLSVAKTVDIAPTKQVMFVSSSCFSTNDIHFGIVERKRKGRPVESHHPQI
jgi:hypothetical protein